MKKVMGKKCWIIPDCELPESGEGLLKGHESVIIVNDNDKEATIRVTLYFTEQSFYDKMEWKVKANSVRCFRTNNLSDMCGFAVPYNTQYAMKVVSDKKIVLQYGRLDNRQVNLAYYTTLGYCE